MLLSSLPSSRGVMLLIFLGMTAFLILRLVFLDGYRRLGVKILQANNFFVPHAAFLYGNETLGIASRIYVLSLPIRTDRRKDMEHLRKTLGLRWTYMEAADTSNPIVNKILHSVRLIRDTHSPSSLFTWPDDVPPLTEDINPWSPGFLTSPPPARGPPPSSPPIPCATRNNTITPYTASLPEFKILTLARIACWYSHVSVIQKIANDRTLRPDDTVIVLEDDVDMERDIYRRLRHVWPFLPAGWDIVYLGHCWSDEGVSAPLTPLENATAINGTLPGTHLHPSHSPLCTHAYALSRTGARRLLLHLRYPLFAYSRSIDRAISWLIQSGRLRSFSVVPSVVVQRKVGQSDVMPGTGSQWRSSLVDGIFGT